MKSQCDAVVPNSMACQSQNCHSLSTIASGSTGEPQVENPQLLLPAPDNKQLGVIEPHGSDDNTTTVGKSGRVPSNPILFIAICLVSVIFNCSRY